MTVPTPVDSSQESAVGVERHRTGLAQLLDSTVVLSENQQAGLRQALEEGEAFFDRYNNARLELAFSSFDRDMRLAVYELLFLLHVNDPKLANFRFAKKEWGTVKGVRKQIPVEDVADLYLEGAPAGVQMIGRLPPSIRNEYKSYVEEVFKIPPFGEEQPEVTPIVTIQSVGSIGTIGHKSVDSDLDLQVIYDLIPFSLKTGDWSDSVFKNAINREHRWWINQLARKQKIPIEELRKDPEAKKKLGKLAEQRVIRTYPGLYKYLVEEDQEFIGKLYRAGADKTLRLQMLHEVLNLMKRAEKLRWVGDLRKKEALLKERIVRIQDYINAKFPEAEIYLFVYTVEWFRQGSYSSTLEFKESSGSAYEMILNYETLMPGIQFTPMVPTHFIFPDNINNDSPLYSRIIDYIRFQAVELWEDHRYRFVDLGNTPDLDVKYVAEHGGAIYWEAFKASSGNLPKAMLNLFRFEMLLDEHLIKSAIQIVKDPNGINSLATAKADEGILEEVSKTQPRDALSIMKGTRPAPGPRGEDPALTVPKSATAQLEAMGAMKTGLPPWAVLEMEDQFPALLQDPWWLRYKALKIGFCEVHGVTGLDQAMRDRMSKVIDLAFCLHVRISDVMESKVVKRGEVKTPSHREKVLEEFLNRAFPVGTPRRINLESLFAGGVRGLLLFEKEMRDLFTHSMSRVEDKMAKHGVRDHTGDSKEVELWLNHYLEHFHPVAHSVPRVIMKHLKVARNGIEITYRPEEGWVFMSVQKQTLLESSAQSGRNVSYLPDRVLLLEKSGFAMGMAQCVVNGYYGVLDKDTPDERLTDIELDDKKLNQGSNIHNDMAFLTQSQVNRLMERIIEAFPYQYYDYMDVLKKDRDVTTVFVMLNLWRYGQVSIMYRDNLSTWFCDEFEVTELFTDALELSKDMRRLLRAKPLLDQIKEHFSLHRIDPHKVELHAWANPNSLSKDRSMSFHDRLKDMEEGVTFVEVLLSLERQAIGDLLEGLGEGNEAPA